ncbi:MAG: alpha/beta hydrolase [Pseudomonadota bacterium]
MIGAPYHSDVALGPLPTAAKWLQADDGKHLRGVAWAGPKAGTVFLFTGRTEYAEKYGDVVAEFAKRGLACVTCDWRGQGLSERFPHHYQIGEVDDFSDYQKDVQAMLAFAKAQNLPKPFYALGHSLGGGILLRALHNGFPAHKALFSSPMWGIQVPPILNAVSRVIIACYRGLGIEKRIAPGRSLENYVERQPFKGNALTNDFHEYHLLRRQVMSHPELGLGGPSLNWVDLALTECDELQNATPPAYDCLTIYAGGDQIVSNTAIEKILSRWQSATGVCIPGAEHEILMEERTMRQTVWSKIDDFLDVQPAKGPKRSKAAA